MWQQQAGRSCVAHSAAYNHFGRMDSTIILRMIIIKIIVSTNDIIGTGHCANELQWRRQELPSRHLRRRMSEKNAILLFRFRGDFCFASHFLCFPCGGVAAPKRASHKQRFRLFLVIFIISAIYNDRLIVGSSKQMIAWCFFCRNWPRRPRRSIHKHTQVAQLHRP